MGLWQDLLIMNCLDVMHVENNVCENVIRTICGEKDNKGVRRNLEVQNLCPHLWLTRNPQNPSWWIMPHANYVLNEREFSTFESWFASLKVPYVHSASLVKHVSTERWASMKACYWHVLMQTLLPLYLRGLMQENTQKAIMCLNTTKCGCNSLVLVH
jgi:hypothetical protein